MYIFAPPATFSDHGFVRVRICGQIIILHGIVGEDLLCVANISLKAHLLYHCSMNRYRAWRALRHLNDRVLACLFKPTWYHLRTFPSFTKVVTNAMFTQLTLVSTYAFRIIVLALWAYNKISREPRRLALFLKATFCERTPVSGDWLC